MVIVCSMVGKPKGGWDEMRFLTTIESCVWFRLVMEERKSKIAAAYVGVCNGRPSWLVKSVKPP